MIPYDTPTTLHEKVMGPKTALTPKIVAHGGGANLRVLKGNPVGHVQHPDGTLHPYFSARMEHTHLPVEHAMLNSIDVDHYHLGQNVPSRALTPHRKITPSAAGWHQWPDTSVSEGLSQGGFGVGPDPGGYVPPGVPYTPRGGQG